jgi:hypothetical protein
MEIVGRRIATEARNALTDPAVKDKLVEQGIVAVGRDTRRKFHVIVAEEILRWRKLTLKSEWNREIPFLPQGRR